MHTMRKTETILVAEDDANDAFFLKRAFQKAGVPTQLRFVSDGQQAIDYISGRGEFSDRLAYPDPDLLLLDIKMPRVSRFQVLHWVRQQHLLKRIPVIIFSSSGEDKDINEAYDLGANSYLIKPHCTEQLRFVARKLQNYWFETNKTPVAFAG